MSIWRKLFGGSSGTPPSSATDPVRADLLEPSTPSSPCPKPFDGLHPDDWNTMIKGRAIEIRLAIIKSYRDFLNRPSSRFGFVSHEQMKETEREIANSHPFNKTLSEIPKQVSIRALEPLLENLAIGIKLECLGKDQDTEEEEASNMLIALFGQIHSLTQQTDDLGQKLTIAQNVLDQSQEQVRYALNSKFLQNATIKAALINFFEILAKGTKG